MFWRVRKCCSVCTIVNRRMKASIHCGTLDFVRGLRQGQPLYNQRTREPSTNVGTCCVSQPESVLSSKAVERDKPEDWGWNWTAGKLLPIKTDLPPAHASLLEVVRCNCRTDCSTQRCTCKKHGLDCSPACGECKGHSFAN